MVPRERYDYVEVPSDEHVHKEEQEDGQDAQRQTHRAAARVHDVQRERDVNEVNGREESKGTKSERLRCPDDGRGRARGLD